MKELDLTTVERIEEYIAFEGLVDLWHWEDTSSHGFKIRLGLTGREKLDSFDGVMKRRKHRGGQRYHCIFTGDDDEIRELEAQFAGRGWAETQGAHLALHIPHLEDQGFFRNCKTKDQEPAEERNQWTVMMLEIGDDEVVVNQTTRAKVEAPVGGARSKAVARLLQDEEFGRWMDHHSLYRIDSRKPDQQERTLAEKDRAMKVICGIKSKVEFDHGNEQAWTLWDRQFHRPFIQWLKRQ